MGFNHLGIWNSAWNSTYSTENLRPLMSATKNFNCVIQTLCACFGWNHQVIPLVKYTQWIYILTRFLLCEKATNTSNNAVQGSGRITFFWGLCDLLHKFRKPIIDRQDTRSFWINQRPPQWVLLRDATFATLRIFHKPICFWTEWTWVPRFEAVLACRKGDNAISH